MKNNKLLYLLTTFITLFIFNINVNAEQGLTCVYKAGVNSNNSRKAILIQEYSGSRKVYVNANKNAKIDGIGWGLQDGIIDISKVSDEKKVNGNLIECPKYIETSKKDTIIFTDKRGISNLFVEENIPSESSKSVKIINTSVTRPDNFNNNGEWLLNHNTIDNSKYSVACKYRKMLDDGSYHYIEMYYGKEKIMFTEYDPQKKVGGQSKNYSGFAVSKFEENSTNYKFLLSIDDEVTISKLLNDYDGVCPPAIAAYRNYYNQCDSMGVCGYYVETTIKLTGTENQRYNIVSDPDVGGVVGSNPLTGEEITLDNTLNIQIDFIKPVINSCEDLLGTEITGYLNIIWNLVKIGIPIILIVLGGIDFVQAIFAGKEDGMKKAQEKFIKRIIIAIIIFLIPTLLSFLLNIVNSIWGNIGNDLCGMIF